MKKNNDLEVETPDGKKKVYVGTGNNNELIQSFFKEENKWQLIDASRRFSNNYYFKWVQVPQDVEFKFFAEGIQLINHVVGISALTTKHGLIKTLRSFEMNKKLDGFCSFRFIPPTYLLDISKTELSDDELTFKKFPSEGIWINKPVNLNCGRGIKLIRDIAFFKEEFFRVKKLGVMVPGLKSINVKPLTTIEDAKKERRSILRRNSTMKPQVASTLRRSQSIDPSEVKPQPTKTKDKFNISKENDELEFLKTSIIQKYVENPYLIQGRKFDIRCYAFVASTSPLFVLFHHGYLRLSLLPYSSEFTEMKHMHLTNASVQKKHPNFEDEKENTIWSMKKFESYVMKDKKLTPDQIRGLYQIIKSIITYCFKAAEKKILERKGTFELIGVDILIDDNLKPYLLEMNSNPALYCDTLTQLDVIPKVLKSVIDTVLYLNQNKEDISFKCKNPENIPLGELEILINEATKHSFLSF